MNDHLQDDAAFWRHFNERTIAATDFGHEAHVRAAYLVIRHHGLENALPEMRAGLRELLAYAQRNGYEPKTGYHETITLFWLRVVALHMARGSWADSNDFLRGNPNLLDRRLMSRHYSKAHLMSDEARRIFVEPDLEPMPDAPPPPA